MTTFVDGPARGQKLSLRRAPIFLRVVEYRMAFDALDQLEDEPKPEESIHLYRIKGKPGGMFVTKRGGGGGYYPIAEYAVVPNPPSDEVLRDKQKWHDWVMKQAAKEKL